MGKIKYSPYESEQVVFLDHTFTCLALSKEQMRKEADLDEKSKDLDERAEKATEEEALELLDEMIANKAERLDLRTAPTPDAKDSRSLGELFAEAWDDGHDYYALMAFAGEVLNVDPFGR